MVVFIPVIPWLPSYHRFQRPFSWKIRCSDHLQKNKLLVDFQLTNSHSFVYKNGTFLIFSRQVSLPFRVSHDSIPPCQVPYIQWPDFLAAMEWRRCARGCHRNGSRWWRSGQKCHGNVLQWPDPDRGRVAHVGGWTPTCGENFGWRCEAWKKNGMCFDCIKFQFKRKTSCNAAVETCSNHEWNRKYVEHIRLNILPKSLMPITWQAE